MAYCEISAGELHPDFSTVDIILCARKKKKKNLSNLVFIITDFSTCENAASRYPRTADFGDDLPGFVEDGQPL